MTERIERLACGIAYCVLYDRGVSENTLKELPDLFAASPRPDELPSDEVTATIEAARLVVTLSESSENLPRTKDALNKSRLIQLCESLRDPKIGVVMGGATKIKQYVFESAKLPEIRGASGLLDRINLYDIPALFSREPAWLRAMRSGKESNQEELEEAEILVTQIRRRFLSSYGVECPDREECVIYASGGDVLAFAPLKLADPLGDAIESLYTYETQIANSVAVWRSCSLVELRFGLRPLQFWTDDLRKCTGKPIEDLAQEYYGDLNPESFLSRKTFGEVATALALEKLKRRDGNCGRRKALKPTSHFETTPYARRCQSCERRNGIVEGPRNVCLCEPCARKRAFGQKAKREVPADRQWFERGGFAWKPLAAKAWGARLEEWLSEQADLALK
jgi:CRISPR-associated protein Cmr2